jgi:Asp-tRNA(Asn)/Glu-tRNA(Gln) amidotransferase C subunit
VPAADEDRTASLAIDHLAELANLPLDEEERQAMAEACEELLDAFALDERQAPEPSEDVLDSFEDEAEPWPADEVEAIREAFPERDGRELST